MLKLSKLTDYAVIVLGCLGQQGGRPVSASYVSEQTKLPEPTVQKVLKLMASKKIITAHNGRLLIDSKLGKGSKFTILLPLNK